MYKIKGLKSVGLRFEVLSVVKTWFIFVVLLFHTVFAVQLPHCLGRISLFFDQHNHMDVDPGACLARPHYRLNHNMLVSQQQFISKFDRQQCVQSLTITVTLMNVCGYILHEWDFFYCLFRLFHIYRGANMLWNDIISSLFWISCRITDSNKRVK